MKVDDSMRFGLSDFTLSILQAGTCSQQQCTETLHPEYLGDICERCITRSHTSSMKRKRSSQGVPARATRDFTIRSPPIQISLNRSPVMKGWRPHGDSYEKVEGITRSNRTIEIRHPLHLPHSDTRSHLTHVHGERTGFPQLPPPHSPRPAVTQRALYTVMPAQPAVPHFNPRGELIQPLFPPDEVLSRVKYPIHSMRPRHNIRMCARVGCGSVIPSIHPSDTCTRCLASYSSTVAPGPGGTRPLGRPHTSPFPILSVAIGPVPPRPGGPNLDDASDALNSPNEMPDNNGDGMEGIEFLYPEELPGAESGSEPTPPGFSGPLSSPARFPIPLRIPPSHRPAKAHPTPKPLARLSQRQDSLVIHPNCVCDTKECQNLLSRDSATTRCFDCIMKDWKSRNNVAKNGKKKSVSWSELVSVLVDGEEDAFSVPLRRSPEIEGVVGVNQIVDGSDEDDSMNITVSNHQASASIPAQKTHRLTIRITPSNRLQAQSTKVPSSEILRDNQCTTIEEPPMVVNDTGLSITDWESDLTDLSSSSDESEGGSPSESDQPKPSGLTIRLPARPTVLKNGDLACSVNRCQKHLPAEYQCKSCISCRGQSPLGTVGVDMVRDDTGDDFDDASPVAPMDKTEQYGVAPNKCSNRDCGASIDLDSPGVQCVECLSRRRAVSEMEMTQLPRQIRRSIKEGKRTQRHHQSHSTKASKSPTYPQHKCLTALLSDLISRLHGFLEAQTYYLLLTAASRKQPQPAAVFAFDGEFSVVSLDFDITRRKEEINRGTLKLKQEIEKLGGLRFNPKNLVSVTSEVIIRRFTCIHETSAALPEDLPRRRSLQVHPKRMQGELEITVLPDRSHRFFPGQRTIVRFRLVG